MKLDSHQPIKTPCTVRCVLELQTEIAIIASHKLTMASFFSGMMRKSHSSSNNSRAAAEEDESSASTNEAGATESKCVYAAVCRQKPNSKGGVTLCEAFPEDAPLIAVELGRKMLKRKCPPGWDDIHCAGWRAVKLPVHDMNGATGYVVVFGGEFDPKRAQATTERFALLLGPIIDGQISNGEAPPASKADTAASDASRTPEVVLELHKTMEPMLVREIEHANSMEKIDILNNQISEIKKIMEVIYCAYFLYVNE
jgi:hypothetical protein